jgi:tRNA(Ser,Leu) C12 N-acetylase TAN1
MHDWNAVITVRDGGFAPTCRLLEEFGLVRNSGFFNTLVMRTGDPFQLLADLQEQLAANPAISSWISRFVPIRQLFTFQSAAEFELHSQEAILEWLPLLENSRFHLRMHRRGFKGKLSSMEEERFLDEFLLQKLAEAGRPGKVAFDDPDAIIALETIGTQAGVSLFNRDELQRFSLLHLD